MAPTNKGPIATGKGKAAAGKGGKAPVAAKVEAAPVVEGVEVEEEQTTGTAAVVEGLPAAGEIGSDAADALSAVQQEWSGHTPAADSDKADAVADAGANGAQQSDDKLDEQINEISNATLTVESNLGTVTKLGNLYKTALHIVLVTPEHNFEQAGRTEPFPVVDLPFAFKKGAKSEPDRSGLALAVVQAFADNFQSVFNRDLLVIGDTVSLDAIAKKVAHDAAQLVADEVVANTLKHLYAVNVNDALGEGVVSSDDDVDEAIAADYLKDVAGFSCTVSESGLMVGGTEEVTFTLVVRIKLTGLADVKDAIGEHGRIEAALTAAQAEAGIDNLQLTWLVGDKSVAHPSVLALLGHLLATEYYTTTTSGELYRSVKDQTVSPLNAFWNFFPIIEGSDVLHHASAAGTNTGTLDGTWVATASYAAEA